MCFFRRQGGGESNRCHFDDAVTQNLYWTTEISRNDDTQVGGSEERTVFLPSFLLAPKSTASLYVPLGHQFSNTSRTSVA